MDVLLIIAGFVLLVLGAELLIRGGASLALRFGLPPLVVGLTVVAMGTSSPELVVSLKAALTGRGSIAVGNVVGSNICNIALILGLAAAIRPLKVQVQLVRTDVPIMVACSLLLLLLLLNGIVSRLEGVLLTVGIVVYVAFSLRQAQRERQKHQQALLDAAPVPTQPGRSPLLDILFLAGGIGMLVLGADTFVKGAVSAARAIGVSEAVIGLTLVALGTSLPELATSAMAAWKKEGDIAIGNIIGSNIFNILFILGATATVSPVHSQGIGWVDLGMMCLLAILMLPLMRTGFVLSRREGLFLLALYGGYLFHLRP
jgi:cation:H+ antiporter